MKLERYLKEAAYAHNLGFEEMMIFFKKASPSDRAEMEKAVEEDNWEIFKKLIKKVLKVDLK